MGQTPTFIPFKTGPDADPTKHLNIQCGNILYGDLPAGEYHLTIVRFEDKKPKAYAGPVSFTKN